MTIAQPEDHKSSTFRYTFPSGETLVLPAFDSVVTFGLARKLRKLPADEQLFAVVEEVCDEAALAVMDKMTAEQAGVFFEAWQRGSGVGVGESAGSST